FDLFPRSRIERLRKIQQVSPAKWRKTKVQMIKPRIHQVQRSHRRVPRISHMSMADLACPNPMRSPQMPATGIKQRIPFPFKTRLARRRPKQKTRVLQPPPQVLLLSLPLRMSEA